MGVTTYIRFPFAISGTRVPIDVENPGTGVVSYQGGYSTDYSLAPGAPGSRDIERSKYNDLLYTFSLTIQQYQQLGTPNFISSADNGGSPFSYSRNARVLWSDGNIYQSLVNTNTTTPTNLTNWELIPDPNQVAYYGVTFGGGVANGDAVYFDGTNFQPAIANGAFQQKVVGIADVTNNRVILSGIATANVALTAGQTYYLSASSSGDYTGSTTAVRNLAQVVQLGVAISTTKLAVGIQSILDTNYAPTNTAIYNVTFEGSVTNGKVVYFDGSIYQPCEVGNTPVQNPIGIADVTNSRVVTSGLIAPYAGLTLTPGSTYYVSEFTPGNYVSGPTGPNLYQVGVAVTSSLLAVCLKIESTQDTLIPPGKTAFFAMNSVPPGWLFMDGATYNIADYPKLFAAIGDQYGGDGITTFDVPNSRGYFTRAWNNGGGPDSGRDFGTEQSDAFESHTHGLASNVNTGPEGSFYALGSGQDPEQAAVYVRFGNSPPDGPATNYFETETAIGPIVEEIGDVETRPSNYAFLNCIKT